ncbi:MAG: hypothetical protein HYY90_04025, partial [Candidatus Omnitrophica bacterium]|nr:hypothetical protein [Candidatus Omnitrophota bacterium]
MSRPTARRLVCALAASLLTSPGVVAASNDAQRASAVVHLLRAAASDLADPADQAALEQLLSAFTDRVTLTHEATAPWVLLTFDRAGLLEGVTVNADILLAAPPLIQRAVILHELEHLKGAAETRRMLNQVPARWVGPSPRSPAVAGFPGWLESTARLHHLVRVLVEDEALASHRDLRYVEGIIRDHGGLAAYLATLPPEQRLPIQRYYERRIQPFVKADGQLDEPRIRR